MLDHEHTPLFETKALMTKEDFQNLKALKSLLPSEAFKELIVTHSVGGWGHIASTFPNTLSSWNDLLLLRSFDDWEWQRYVSKKEREDIISRFFLQLGLSFPPLFISDSYFTILKASLWAYILDKPAGYPFIKVKEDNIDSALFFAWEYTAFLIEKSLFSWSLLNKERGFLKGEVQALPITLGDWVSKLPLKDLCERTGEIRQKISDVFKERD